MLRLRKSLGFTQHAFQQKKSIYIRRDITPELVNTDARYLQILIFKAESDWAFAMNLKQKMLHKQTKLNPNRIKVHALKRFRSAAETARNLPSDALD